MGNSKVSNIMENENLIWLLHWFAKQCDGDWEHGNGIRIGTLDNPGWYLTVSLTDTECEDKEFKEIIIERSSNDWLHCFVKEGRFEGPCGLLNLPEVLQIFRDWAESCQKERLS
jgi:hypothetical protein